MSSTFLIIAAVIIVILILRSVSEKRIELPRQGDYAPPPVAGNSASFEPIEGEADGEPYAADMYDAGIVTVSVEISGPLKFMAEIDGRGGHPELKPEDPFRAEVEELLSLGAVYIDVTGENDWVAADFPLSAKIDAAFCEKVARLLLRIRNKASA